MASHGSIPATSRKGELRYHSGSGRVDRSLTLVARPSIDLRQHIGLDLIADSSMRCSAFATRASSGNGVAAAVGDVAVESVFRPIPMRPALAR
jgi:hypothetical protein